MIGGIGGEALLELAAVVGLAGDLGKLESAALALSTTAAVRRFSGGTRASVCSAPAVSPLFKQHRAMPAIASTFC